MPARVHHSISRLHILQPLKEAAYSKGMSTEQQKRQLTQRCTRQPFYSAMHAKVHHSISLVLLLQPLVEGGILGVGGQVSVKEQPHGVAFYPQGGLHPYPDIA